MVVGVRGGWGSVRRVGNVGGAVGVEVAGLKRVKGGEGFRIGSSLPMNRLSDAGQINVWNSVMPFQSGEALAELH